MKQKNTHDIPNNLKTCKSFFLWKNRPPTSYFDLPAQLERSGTPMLKRTQKFWEQAVLDKMRSNLKKERCLRCWKLKDHLLFSKLKKLSNDLHPLSSNKKSRGEEIGERGTLVEFWTSYNYYCCSPKMKEKNEISSTRGESKWVVKPLSKISHGCSIITLQRVIFKG